jgi:hypothetical protein
MTDEGIWLLVFGRKWVSLEAIELEKLDPVFTNLAKAKKLEINKNFECVRLKEQQ